MQIRALCMKAAGEPELFEMREIGLAWPQGDSDVLVRLRAAGVNPADAYFWGFGPYVGDAAGCVLGHDGAGGTTGKLVLSMAD